MIITKQNLLLGMLLSVFLCNFDLVASKDKDSAEEEEEQHQPVSKQKPSAQETYELFAHRDYDEMLVCFDSKKLIKEARTLSIKGKDVETSQIIVFGQELQRRTQKKMEKRCHQLVIVAGVCGVVLGGLAIGVCCGVLKLLGFKN